MPAIRALILVLALSAFAACAGPEASDKATQTKQTNEAVLLAKLRIDAKTPNVLYTYLDDKGVYQTVDSADKVPDPFRNDVVVVNLALSPEVRASVDKVAVADLNRQNTDGSFQLRLEDRQSFETALKLKRQWSLSTLTPKAKSSTPGAPAKAYPPNTDKVVLYTTSWCGYCRKVREFLTARKIPFTERDVEKEDGAQEELQARCQAAGVACNGVPVVDVKGRIIPGYNPQALEKLLGTPTP